MSRVRYVPDPAGMDRLRRAPWLRDALLDVAEAGAELARSYAPVVTGSYRDGVHAEGSEPGEVAAAAIVASASHSVYVEYQGEEPARPLGRAAAALDRAR